jgi:carbamoyltransferase
VRDGQIVAAINEERLTRRKLDSTYPPVRSIREVIRLSGIPPAEIDAVAIAGLHWKDLISRTLESVWADIRDFHAWNDYFPHLCRVLYRTFYFWRATGYDAALKFLKDEYGISPKVYYIEHHEAHAASAYRTGKADPVLIITADGVGDDLSITFSKGERSVIRRLEAFHYPNSFGQFYTACTQILGFKAGRHEGKITGLSGYGGRNQELLDSVEQTLFTRDGFRLNKRYYSEGFMRPRRSTLKGLLRGRFQFYSMEYRNYKKPLKRLLRGYAREDVAYTFQFLLEREMVRLARRHVNGEPLHFVLAGGVFANVKLNMALSQNLLPESVYVFPNMGDGGLCVGAALSVTASAPASVQSMYLGTEYSEEEILSALNKHQRMPYIRPDDMAQTVATELADKKIVARFDGRMEFGPRALGNRSILYHCGDRSVNDWLNRQLNRTEFMPFAPICIYEDAEDYFQLMEGEKRPCEFMTLVVKCTDRMIEACPAAVHVDGTARPQLLRRDNNPGMYDILTAYRDLTGISCVINTSFNMHEEPIVRSPEEAIIAFQQSKLDLLILGPFLVSQPEQVRQTPYIEKSILAAEAKAVTTF